MKSVFKENLREGLAPIIPLKLTVKVLQKFGVVSELQKGHQFCRVKLTKIENLYRLRTMVIQDLVKELFMNGNGLSSIKVLRYMI